MKTLLPVILVCAQFVAIAQSPVGHYESRFQGKKITLNRDHSFEFTYNTHPVFVFEDGFSENGTWMQKGDTIILNPQLAENKYIEYSFSADEQKGDTNILLTLNHIKRDIDALGNVVKSDTFQLRQADYYFNNSKGNERIRITATPTTRCAFAGPIPKEMITNQRTVTVGKPIGQLQKITIGCYEYSDMKEFIIDNPNANRLVLNVYNNYYLDGMMRNKKILLKNKNTLLTERNKKGRFYIDAWANHNSKMKKSAQ